MIFIDGAIVFTFDAYTWEHPAHWKTEFEVRTGGSLHEVKSSIRNISITAYENYA